MAEERQILLEIEIDRSGAQKQLDENAKQLELNKAELSTLNKEYKSGLVSVDAYSKKKLQLTQANKELGSENRQLIKQLDTEDNSLNALRANLSKLVKERNNVNQQTEKGAARFKELQGRILETTDAIKGQEEAGGDFTRSVGNYGKALQSNVPIIGRIVAQLTAFKAGLLATIQGLGLSTTGLTGTSKALRIFKIALISTGIGAIIVVLGSFIAFLLTTQKGIDAVTSVTRPLQQIFQRLIGVVQMLGEAFTNPIKAIENIRKAIQAFINDPLGSITAAGEAVAKFVEEAVDAGTAIDKLTKSIELENIALVKLEGTNQRIFEQQKEIAEDQTNSLKVRIAAAREALRATTELEQARIDQLNRIIALKELENEANDTGRDGLLELAELERARDDAAAAAAGKRTSVNNLLNTILKEQNATLSEQIALEKELQAFNNFKQDAELVKAQERIGIKRDEVAEIKKLTFDSQQAQINSQNVITDSQREQARIRQDIEAIALDNNLMAAGQVAGALSGVFEQNTAAFKATASAEALISTYLAITKTLGAFAGVPVPGFAIAQAVAIGITGLANVAKINSVNPKGGGGGGGGSISTPRIQRTSLSGAFDRNQLTGSANNAQSQTDQINSAIGSMPAPVVKVSDINKTQQRTAQVKVTSTL